MFRVGGEEKAFDIPLSRPMIRCIIRTIRLGRILYPEQASIWLFPAESETGHLEEHKEDRGVLSPIGDRVPGDVEGPGPHDPERLARRVVVGGLDLHGNRGQLSQPREGRQLPRQDARGPG